MADVRRRKVLEALRRRRGRGGVIRTTGQELADSLGVSRRTVLRAVKELTAAGLLTVRRVSTRTPTGVLTEASNPATGGLAGREQGERPSRRAGTRTAPPAGATASGDGLVAAYERGEGPCMSCGHATAGFIDEDGQRVGALSVKPPVGLRCSTCGNVYLARGA